MQAPSSLAPGSSTLPANAGNTSFCDQTMTCICPLCQTERDQRIAQGVHRSKRQPWATRAELRNARRAA